MKTAKPVLIGRSSRILFVSILLLVSVRPSNSTGSEPTSVSFRLDVAPIFSKAGCNMGACHGNLNGKGGFRLSLRGEDPGFDRLMITREALGRRVDRFDPNRSLLLLKPTGAVPHEGGRRFTSTSTEAATLARWIREGALDDVESAPAIKSLAVEPAERVIDAPILSQALRVVAVLSDGTARDVTKMSTFDVNDPTKAKVDHDGLVVVDGPVETVVAIRYGTGRAVSRLAFLADRPDYVAPLIPLSNAIDRHVFGKLAKLKIRPSELAEDSTFLRRAYLDAIGRLPSADESRSFLANSDPLKRSQVIERLVDRPEFADFWALKWADLLRNEEKTMGVKGAWVFQRWLRDQIAADSPIDRLVRDLLVAQGSNWAVPATSFYRTNTDALTAAESVGQVFLGVRLQCARCHNHPFDLWTQDDYYGLAGVFSNVKRKELNNDRKDKLDKHEINGDVLIYESGQPGIKQPRSGKRLSPKAPGGPVFDPADGSARRAFAEWLTHDNSQFAKNIANRVWFHMVGRGIVDPVDDFRESNPPSNPGLLNHLAESFVRNGYRLKPLVVEIMSSATYQLSSYPNESNAKDEANFAKSQVRLLHAEVLLDALGDVFEHRERFKNTPKSMRTTQLAGVVTKDPFLKIFGKPERLLTCECERSDSTTLAQAFQLINGDAVKAKIEFPKNRIGKRLESGLSDEQILEELTLAALSRTPTASETAGFLQYVRKASNRRRAWEDVAWAIVNSKEFLLRH